MNAVSKDNALALLTAAQDYALEVAKQVRERQGDDQAKAMAVVMAHPDTEVFVRVRLKPDAAIVVAAKIPGGAVCVISECALDAIPY